MQENCVALDVRFHLLDPGRFHLVEFHAAPVVLQNPVGVDAEGRVVHQGAGDIQDVQLAGLEEYIHGESLLAGPVFANVFEAQAAPADVFQPADYIELRPGDHEGGVPGRAPFMCPSLLADHVRYRSNSEKRSLFPGGRTQRV